MHERDLRVDVQFSREEQPPEIVSRPYFQRSPEIGPEFRGFLKTGSNKYFIPLGVGGYGFQGSDLKSEKQNDPGYQDSGGGPLCAAWRGGWPRQPDQGNAGHRQGNGFLLHQPPGECASQDENQQHCPFGWARPSGQQHTI